MSPDISERSFEEAIECGLLQYGPDACAGDATLARETQLPCGETPPGGYRKRRAEEYDRALCLLPRDVVDFVLATQPKEWKKLEQHHGVAVKEQFLKRLAAEIERRGALDVLRNGIKDSGCKFRLAWFRPASGLNEETRRLHAANLFTTVRQVHFSTKSEKSLDLMLFLNGIPLFTVELKNPLSGQDVENAIRQYKTDRDPREPLFAYGRCLAHFAVDPELVYVTTQLAGTKTRFLPFNQGKFGGAGNPPVPPTRRSGVALRLPPEREQSGVALRLPPEREHSGVVLRLPPEREQSGVALRLPPHSTSGYATGYLWEETWARDSVLDLLRQFIHEVEEEDDKGRKTGKRFLIFPRYQQLDGSVYYTPPPDFVGTDSFTYVLNDGYQDSNVATITFDVRTNNPVAGDDSLNVPTQNGTSSLNVLLNDFDIDGDTLTITAVSVPDQGGTATSAGDHIQYTPLPGFLGVETFTYEVSDGFGGTDTALVTVTVFNDPPVAGDDAYSVTEDASLSVAAPGVLANDRDPYGDPLSAVVVTDVGSGSLTLNADGSFTYTPDADFNGTDLFTYRASDGTNSSAPATVTVVVNPLRRYAHSPGHWTAGRGGGGDSPGPPVSRRR